MELSYEATSPEYYLKSLRDVFWEYYFDTSDILIKSEQFSGSSNQDVFYYLSGILDEIFFLNKAKNKDIIDKKIKKIATMFIGIQDFVLLTAIYVIKEEFKEIQLNNQEINQIISTLERKLQEINFSKNDLWNLPKLDMKKANKINQANIPIKKAFSDMLQLLSKDLDFSKAPKPDFEKLPLGDDEFIKKFQRTMNQDYGISRMVFYDVIRRSGTHYKFSITELRDALDHIAKSLFRDKDKANRELICSQEHIRRAAVESLHDYVLSKLAHFEFQLKITNVKRKKIDLMKKIAETKKEICIARYSKGDETWYFSVDHFYKALKKLGK